MPSEQVGELDPVVLVSGLIDRMRELNIPWNETHSWTRKVKSSIEALLSEIHSEKIRVQYSDVDRFNQEFMLDLVAWSPDRKELLLAVECEWDQNLTAVEADFTKLMVMKATIKLMIFACNDSPRKFKEELIRDQVERCLRMSQSHIRGERYIFINFAQKPRPTGWWIEIEADGKLPEHLIYNEVRNLA